MLKMLVIANCTLVLGFICYVIVSSNKIRRMSNEVENMYKEQDKLKFRIYVMEKKQAVYHEKTAV